MSDTSTTPESATPSFQVTPGYRRVVLGLLFLVGLFNYGDRFMLAVLLPQIKADLDLSDTQIGFITGVGFAVFYAFCGIPIARLADRYSRRVIIASVVALWSVMTAICGLTQSFVQLTVARILVGVGEAGGTPASQSLIADYIPRSKRASSLAIYALSSPVGILLGFLLGSLIAGAYGWRIALFAFGLPGLILATVILAALRDPPRGYADGAAQKTAPIESLWSTWRTLAARRSFVHACMAGGAFSFMFLAFVQWAPSFFSRSHGMSTAEIGTWLAFIIGIAQILGISAGGAMADRLMRIDPRRPLWMSGIAMVASTPFFVWAFSSSAPLPALAALFAALFFISLQGATLYAVVQNVAGVQQRSVAAAILVLFFNLMGGLGPQAVGIASDRLAPGAGADSLRYALLAVIVVAALWAAGHFLLAARTVRRDVLTPAVTGN